MEKQSDVGIFMPVIRSLIKPKIYGRQLKSALKRDMTQQRPHTTLDVLFINVLHKELEVLTCLPSSSKGWLQE